MTADALIAQVRSEVLDWRRHLHRNPELSFHEQDTAQFVRETLESMPHLSVTQPAAALTRRARTRRLSAAYCRGTVL